MTKSVNKKFLIVFAVLLAIFLSASVTTAGVSRADELTPSEKAEQIYDKTKEFYSELRAAQIEIDKLDYSLESVYTAVGDDINRGKDVSSQLDGDTGLNGIKKIAELVCNFYNAKIKDGNVNAASAKNHLKKFSVSNFKYCDYDYNAAELYINSYTSAITVKDYSRAKEEIENIYSTYLGDIRADKTAGFLADYKDYVIEALGVETEEEAEAIKDEAITSLDTCVRDEDANKIVSDFNARFTSVNKYIEYLDQKVVRAKFDDVKNSPYTNAERKAQVYAAMEICENAVWDANEFYSGDVAVTNASSEIKRLYINIGKMGVEAIMDGYENNFGPSAYDVIIANRDMARSLLESVTATEYLKIPNSNSYSYRKETSSSDLVFKSAQTVDVVYGSDVVRAFEDSYTVKGALKYNGKTSATPEPKKSSITYKGADFKFTLTSVDALGNEVKDFDVDAYLEVRLGTTPSIERNINTILSRKDLKDKINLSVSDEEKKAIAEELFGKHIQYFYTVTVYEGGIVREEFDGRYLVEIEYKEDVLSKNKDNFNVINYYHTEIIGVVAENKIETEGKSIMFYTDNFSQFALLADVEWVDLAKWVIIGVVAFIVLIWLVLLIVYLVRNRKFTVIFNANGGRPTTHMRLKHKEKFSYPKNPVRRGHVFMGWFTTRKCDTRFASTEMINKKRVTVYAKWITEEQYKALIAETQEEKVPVIIKEVVKPVEEKAEKEVVAPIPVVIPAAVEEVKEEVVEEKAAFDAAALFDELKAEICGYEKADDLVYGLEKKRAICGIKVVADTIELEVALDKDELLGKGYKVIGGDNLASKTVIETEEDYETAKEIVEEVMFENGLKKSDKPAVDSSETNREEGFTRYIECEKIAETADELYKVLRVYAKSFVLGDGAKGEDKPLLKMFTLYERVNLYLNYFEEGMNECDEEIKALGYRSLIVVSNAEECIAAEGYIKAMMKEYGLVRYPTEINIAEDNSDKGFAYTLKY